MLTLELTRDQIVDEMERVTRRRLGIGAKEALHLYETGELQDAGEIGDVLVLADLLEPSDPIRH